MTDLQLLEDEIRYLRNTNTQLMATVNSDAPVTHKFKAYLAMPKIKQEFLDLIPPGTNKEQILKTEMQSLIFDIMQSDELQKCTAESFLFCLKDALSRGLRIGSVHKEAWPIKFTKKVGGNFINEAKIIPGYRGYINRAWNEHKIRLVPGTIAKDEVQYVKKYDSMRGILDIEMPLGSETKLHTRENIEYVYITAIYPDGSSWSQLYTKEAIEEKSKTGKGYGENRKFDLGAVWKSTDRLTDYKEMLHKGAIIQFCKTMPERSLQELVSLEYIPEVKDVTPSPVSSTSDLNKEIFAEVEPEADAGEVEVKENDTPPLNTHISTQKLPDLNVGLDEKGNANWAEFAASIEKMAKGAPDNVKAQIKSKFATQLKNMKNADSGLYEAVMLVINQGSLV